MHYADQGSHNPVRIELPAGTYVPEFRWSDAPAATLAPAAPELDATPAEPASPKPTSRIPLLIGGAAALICIAAAVVVWERNRPANTPLDQFWSPVISGTTHVSICAAFNPEVYGLNRDPNSSGPVRAEDFVLLTDQFVGGGDLIAVSRFGYADPDAAPLSVEAGECGVISGSAVGSGDPGGLLLHAVEGD